MTSVADGFEALGVLREASPFAVVVSDLSMPHLDGRSLVEQICARFPALPVVVVSGNPDADPRGYPLRVPILQKPVDREVLLVAIRRATAQAIAVLSVP